MLYKNQQYILLLAITCEVTPIKQEVLSYSLTLMVGGAVLAVLHLVINGVIGKMKGKSEVIKILFYSTIKRGFTMPKLLRKREY